MKKEFKFIVFDEGDWSVGITPFSANITINIEDDFLEDDSEDFIEVAKNMIEKYYQHAACGRLDVFTEEEYSKAMEEERKLEEEINRLESEEVEKEIKGYYEGEEF